MSTLKDEQQPAEPSPTPEYFASTDAAALAGVSIATLHSYGDAGLIKPLRTARGVRLYTRAQCEQARQIYRARQERHGRTGVRREQS